MRKKPNPKTLKISTNCCPEKNDTENKKPPTSNQQPTVQKMLAPWKSPAVGKDVKIPINLRGPPATSQLFPVAEPKKWLRLPTRWAPTSYKWSYNHYKWPYNWVTGVITLLIEVITPLVTSRGPTLYAFQVLSKEFIANLHDSGQNQ